MKKQYLWIVMCLLMVMLTACGGDAPAQVETTAPVEVTETAAPEAGESTQGGILSQFATVDLEGNAVDQEVLKNARLTMVNVWATYCSPCLSEMPDLGELAKEYADQNVQIIGLVSDVLDHDGSLSDSQLELANQIVELTGADYLNIVPSEDLLGLLYQITAVPTTFFVDQDGNQVGGVYLGAKDKAAWSAIIEETLQGVAQ